MNLSPQPRHPGAVAAEFPVQGDLLAGGDGALPSGARAGYAARPGDDALMGLLASLAQDASGRWICLVAPPRRLDGVALQAAGIDPARILLVHPRARHDALQVVEDSLRCGSCCAVLAWPGLKDETVLQRLTGAARAGNTRAFLYDSRAGRWQGAHRWQAWPRH